MAPMGRSMVKSRSLPKKTARSSNLRAQYDRYDGALLDAKRKNAEDDARIAEIQDRDRNREAARRAANYAARLENAQALQLQADSDHAKRAIEREMRRSLKHDNPSRAFPIGAPLDLAGERREQMALAAELGAQSRARRDTEQAALVAERARDSDALAKALECHTIDRVARHNLAVKQQIDLGRDWQRQIDYVDERASVTKLGSLVRGQ